MKFFNALKLIWAVQTSAQKYSVLIEAQISSSWLCPASQEGRIAIVTDVERGMR
jgi:hypothetical protein